MGNYKKMLDVNKKKSKQKEELAVACIKSMIANNEQVTVSDLIKRTNLSRSFIYNNTVVRAELENAKEEQRGKNFTYKKKVIIDRALERENQRMKKELDKMKNIIENLKKENETLRKKANAELISTIKSLREELPK